MSRANKKLMQTTALPKKPHRRSPDSQRVFRCPAPIGGRVLIDIERVAEKIGCCVTHPYRLMKNESLKFPRPIRVSPGRTAFFEDEIDRWIENRPRV